MIDEHFDLLAGGQILDRDGPALGVFLADDDRPGGSDGGGLLELLAERPAACS